jgi:hypothetical protein
MWEYQTRESDKMGGVGYKEDDEEGDGFVGDYVLPEVKEIARFGESHFGTIGGHNLSQYARGDHSIDKMYGIEGRRTVPS